MKNNQHTIYLENHDQQKFPLWDKKKYKHRMIEPDLVWMYSQVVIWNHSFSRVHQTLTRRYLSLSKLPKLLCSVSLPFCFTFLSSSHTQLSSYVTLTATTVIARYILFFVSRSRNTFSRSYALSHIYTHSIVHYFYIYTLLRSLTHIYSSRSYFYSWLFIPHT
mgnify:CR=1 FL=1